MVSQPNRRKTTARTTYRKKNTVRPKSNRYVKWKSKASTPKYGSSKLEDRFAKDFLDKLGVKYVRQYEAKDIKRFYDFYLPDKRMLIEVDGSYYHAYGLVYEEMSPMQKRNTRVDKIKNMWAGMHGIPLLRIWEHDINNNPQKVMETLKQFIGISSEKKQILENKKKRH